MKRLKTLGTLLFTAVLLTALSGCEKEGPAEKAGKEVDNAMEEAGDKLEEAGEDIKEAADGN